MSQSLALHCQPAALELHNLLRDLDPVRWHNGLEEAMRRRIAALEARLSTVLSRSAAEEDTQIQERLLEVAELLRERVPSADLPVAEIDDAWSRYRAQLQAAYAALSAALQSWSVHVPQLRPTNYARNAWHFLISVVIVVLIEEVVSARGRWLVPLAFAGTFWCLEAARQLNARARAFLLWIFSAIAHPYERYRINSATWFATALVILGAAFEPLVCTVAVAVLGSGDPTAALVGRRIGRTKLIGERSLEGSIAFVLAGALAALAGLSVWHGDLSWWARLVVALCAALAGAVTELLSGPVDDNLSIPLGAAMGGWVALQAF